MAALSPTPILVGHDDLLRGSMSRPDIKRFSPRPYLRKATFGPKATITASEPQAWKFSIGDSSDDEDPVAPMKFSAAAKALLGDDASVADGSSPSRKDFSHQQASQENSEPKQRQTRPLSLSASFRDIAELPAESRSGSPRIVRIAASAVAPSTLRKTQSVREELRSPHVEAARDLITPAPRARNYRGISPKNGSESLPTDNIQDSGRPQSSTGSVLRQEHASNSRDHSDIHDAAAHMESLSITQSKGEDLGLQTSQRRRGGLKITGRMLSGPARRGLKRRQSDDDQSPLQEAARTSDRNANYPLSGAREHYQDESPQTSSKGEKEAVQTASPENQRPPYVRFQSQANHVNGSPDPKHAAVRTALAGTMETNSKSTARSAAEPASSGKRVQPMFKMPPLPALPSRFDQENEPPPTFKRNKPNGIALSDRREKFSIMADEKMLAPTPVTVSPQQRPALAPRNQNTPHRPAPPPPPKMTVLETATATAGAASASQARKKRNQYMSVNGRYFTRMDCIGRGGSSKVYRVMAENYKVFALKRVALEDQDELAIQGYKGEIDLLRKLENVDRVVRLFDYEINEEKHTLSVLMEMGESDLNRVLTHRLNAEDARLDITFTRYFWKEMLECVQAVHAHDIVHSDLKPANFLLLQGRLKLIDFGISNAIAENTVNVHREQHIGTPNYMSPEALIDSNAAAGLPSSEGKMMKLGKPSDIWSLGCILYQMVYGKPPFAHIANQMQRIMAIPNPRHAINFPETGVGGVTLPVGMIRTLRRCLSRDQTLRPTVDELLAFGDPFLFPDVLPSKETVPVGQELIARLQHNIIKHIREKGMPNDAELATWPARFFASIKAAVEEGRA